jgi:hypothetical protein
MWRAASARPWRSGFSETLKRQAGEGCNIYGYLEVNKVAGNFHFAPGKSFQHGRVENATWLVEQVHCEHSSMEREGGARDECARVHYGYTGTLQADSEGREGAGRPCTLSPKP